MSSARWIAGSRGCRLAVVCPREMLVGADAVARTATGVQRQGGAKATADGTLFRSPERNAGFLVGGLRQGRNPARGHRQFTDRRRKPLGLTICLGSTAPIASVRFLPRPGFHCPGYQSSKPRCPTLKCLAHSQATSTLARSCAHGVEGVGTWAITRSVSRHRRKAKGKTARRVHHLLTDRCRR